MRVRPVLPRWFPSAQPRSATGVQAGQEPALSPRTRVSVPAGYLLWGCPPTMAPSSLPLVEVRRLSLQNPLFPGGPLHLASGSGLVAREGVLYVVPDDGLHLGCFCGEQPGRLIRLLQDPDLPADAQERKARKPDLESLALAPDGRLLALGSGSAPGRNRGVLLSPEDETAQVLDFEPLYATLRQRFPDLNVEGAAFSGDVLRLAQRGNGQQGSNALIDLDAAAFMAAAGAGKPLDSSLIREIRSLDLGSLPGSRGPVPLTVTDLAARPGGGFVFTAAAEDTDNPYLDGPVVGSVVGILSPDGQVSSVHRLQGAVKVEGVQAEACPEGGLKLLLVTDADDPGRPARLFQTRLPVARPEPRLD